ncbi:hypothetical protein PG993_014049 [Apiospora rasikravindrae]|uniref:F-box domain-containing protein n=1 Tax=Apiospora rasikravindrae TaxID=990691 RepID=A0ABR1RS31_9PEZI
MSQTQNSRLSSLPNELMLQILGELDWRGLRSITLLNRDFRWRFLDYWFDACYENEVNSKSKSDWCEQLFCHGVRTNSSEIVQYLATRKNDLDLTGPSLPSRQARHRLYYHGVSTNESYLHMAIAGDAPHAASFLVKLGADVDGDIGHRPDLPALCLALARVNISSQKERDAALRIACRNALPRIAAHLLAKGANPNSVGRFGMGALHVTLMRRPPSSMVDGPQRVITEFDIYSTLRLLLDYGAAVDLPTQTTRAHICDPQCWKSMRCDHSGQTGLHLAAASGFPMCARLLLDNGADHRHQTADGYTALYGAICQAKREVADILLACSSEANPVVNFPQEATALHIACRFAYTDMVNAMLLCGADVNVVDAYGHTPCTKPFARWDQGEQLISRVPTPRQKAEAHPFSAVREMFILDKTKPPRIRPPAAYTEIRGPLQSTSSKNTSGGPKPVDRQTPTIWAEPKTEHVIRRFGEPPKKPIHPSGFTSPGCVIPESFPSLLDSDQIGKPPQSSVSDSVSFWSNATQKMVEKQPMDPKNAGEASGDQIEVKEQRKTGRGKRAEWKPLQL